MFRKRSNTMRGFIRYLLVPFVTGMILGWIFVAILYAQNSFGLATFAQQSEGGWIYLAMLMINAGGTFGICFAATELEFLADEK